MIYFYSSYHDRFLMICCQFFLYLDMKNGLKNEAYTSSTSDLPSIVFSNLQKNNSNNLGKTINSTKFNFEYYSGNLTSVTCQLSPANCHLPTAICRLPTVTCCLGTHCTCQLSTPEVCQLSAVNALNLSTVTCKHLKPVKCHLSTFGIIQTLHQ